MNENTKGLQHLSFEKALEKARNNLATLTSTHCLTWHLDDCDWSIDQDAGVIVFHQPSGGTVIARVQIVGSYSPANNTWVWAWDHPSVDNPLCIHSRKVMSYGIKVGAPKLTTRKLECDESDCWDFAALACLLNDAQGAYRAPVDGTLIFATFDDISISPADNGT